MNLSLRKVDSLKPAAVPRAEARIVPFPKKKRLEGKRLNLNLEKLAAQIVPPILVIMILLIAWQLAAGHPGARLPSPLQIYDDSHDLILHPLFDNGGTDKGLGWHILASLSRVALGYLIAAVVGVAVGTLIGASQFFSRGFDPIFQILRTVPPLAWLPISLAAFHDSQPSAIFVIFITSVWPVIINTAAGIRNIPQDYRNVARVINLNPLEYFVRIMVPAAAPYIFTGLRIGIGLSWLAIVAAEMLIGGVGIGFFIWDAWNSSHISDIIVALVYVGLVGFMLDRLVTLAGHIVTRGTSAN
jgi:nitrate/nitrite transport system permease protein